MSTFMAKPGQVPRRWFVIDAADQVVGRLAVQIATILRGKHRPEYTPHIDTGEFVIVINASRVRFTGKKLQTKTYQWYTRYPGGLKPPGYTARASPLPSRTRDPPHCCPLAEPLRPTGRVVVFPNSVVFTGTFFKDPPGAPAG